VFIQSRASGKTHLSQSRHNAASEARCRSRLLKLAPAIMEALDRRTLLSVSFKFNIIDPTNKYAGIHADLQRLLNAAGSEWTTHLLGNASLEYNVGFTDDPAPIIGGIPKLATGAAHGASVIGTDTIQNTGSDVYQLGTITEMQSGVDPNGLDADAGITIYGQNIRSWYFDPDTNTRNQTIPDNLIDGYTVLLQEIAHSIGFTTSRDPVGNVPDIGMYTYDQHITGFGNLSFGLTKDQKVGFGADPTTATDDLATVVYGGGSFSFNGQINPTPVGLELAEPSLLGNGRYVDLGVTPNPPINYQNLTDLSSDLMGGLPDFGAAGRKTISKLDLAILKDTGVPISLSVDPTPEGLYVVNGTGLNDVISLTKTNGTVLIRVNNSATTFDPLTANSITAIVVNGLNGDDVITIGGDMPAVAINGGAGNDTIFGGSRGDSIFGGGGNDLIAGGGGGDLIRGGDGNDVIYGQGGSDRLYGDAGKDYVDGGLQTDRINGGSGNDALVGGTENDFLFGDAGNDLLAGAGGKDRLDGGSGSDTFFGGNGNDSVDYSRSTAAVTVTIDASPDDGTDGEGDDVMLDVENVIGSPFNDVITGSEGPNSLMGGSGNDIINGAGGNDTLEGNDGNDNLSGGGGNDSLDGGAGNDAFSGGVGLDVMLGGDGDDTFATRDTASDTIDGGAGIDSLVGDKVDVLSNVESADVGVLPPP
jgi:Ca2+-binding RTX toxin-like protein